MTAFGDGRGPDAGDPEIGRRVRQAYATRLDIDTAAHHLWSMEHEARRLRGRRRRQRLVSAAASLLLLLAGAGTVAGSAAALPGETLYPVKESLEQAELRIAFSDAANARAHLRHSRVRLEELEQAAESNPEVVPEIAERFYASLNRAAALGNEAVAVEVAALRTSASLLMDRLARALDPSIARSLSVARASQDGSVPADSGPQGLADDGGTVEPVGGAPTGRPPGDGDEGPAGEAAEPLEPTPETAVAEADREQDGDPDEGPEELKEETATAELPPETVEVQPREPVESSPEASSDDDETAEKTGDGASPKTMEPSSSTAQAGSSPETDGDG